METTPISTSTISPKIAATFAYRSRLGSAIRKKHPNRIPIIVELNNGGNLSKRKIRLNKNKFIVPAEYTLGHFICNFKRGKFLNGLDEQEAIFFFFGGDKISSNSKLMGDLFEMYKEDDGFLYAKVDCESTFG